MWLMASRNRPKEARQVIDECWDTGMRSPALLYVDLSGGASDDGYDFSLPCNWTRIAGAGNLSGAYKYMFQQYPLEPCYGFIADDNHPETYGWCERLEAAAGLWHFSQCNDRWVWGDPKMSPRVLRGLNMTAGICWGGALPRALGWLWPPIPTVQASNDWIWCELFADTPIPVFLEDVIIRHDNWRTGRRGKDGTDVWGKWVQPDIDMSRVWLTSRAFKEARQKLIDEYRKANE